MSKDVCLCFLVLILFLVGCSSAADYYGKGVVVRQGRPNVENTGGLFGGTRDGTVFFTFITLDTNSVPDLLLQQAVSGRYIFQGYKNYYKYVVGDTVRVFESTGSINHTQLDFMVRPCF